ncbi:hypothetical protein LOTGIDRAFT_121808 [Lottia gigantea]|uniref:C2H2-type domain-containing protein n=1 Tax=Lottia gigantea TaxID=225164 RepID=V4AEJ5_LOTGI|nr:hypothetical protein LOTGIDRAFT_121808 [Lottia gigantea]ESO91771.1 hypothetical protein LOTGIDRAFT_121808 [Lottia gigantea]
MDESTIKQPEEASPILESNPNIPKELLASRSISCYCQYCEIIYLDRTIYQLHMGLHNVNNPWQCNACGKVCENRLEFSSHVLHY